MENADRYCKIIINADVFDDCPTDGEIIKLSVPLVIFMEMNKT